MEKAEINYSFVAVPTNLFYLLDNNCRSILFTLIQASSYFAKEDEYFFLTKESLQSLSGLSQNVTTAALDTLYINKIISIKTIGKSRGKYVNHYKVNFEIFKNYEGLTFEELKNPELKIETVKYKNNYQPQYIKDFLAEESQCKTEGKQVCNSLCKQPCKKVTTNIDNTNNINNIYNIKDHMDQYNINIKDQYNNIEYNIKDQYKGHIEKVKEEMKTELINSSEQQDCSEPIKTFSKEEKYDNSTDVSSSEETSLNPLEMAKKDISMLESCKDEFSLNDITNDLTKKYPNLIKDISEKYFLVLNSIKNKGKREEPERFYDYTYC